MASQEGAALLPPVEASLGELQARLTQYVERLHLSDADRARVAAARDAVSDARRQIEQILRDEGSWRHPPARRSAF